MNFRCIDCKQVVEDKDIVILNSTRHDERILFVCKPCLAKPKAPQPDKKEAVNNKLSGLFEVLNGGKQ